MHSDFLTADLRWSVKSYGTGSKEDGDEMVDDALVDGELGHCVLHLGVLCIMVQQVLTELLRVAEVIKAGFV